MSGFNSSPPNADAPDQPVLLTTHELGGFGGAGSQVLGGRVKLLLLLLVCAAPVIASYITYYVIKPDLTRSYGSLIQPLREVPDLLAVDLQGRRQSLRALRDQWLLVSVGASACPAACQRRLYLQRQIRESMGAEKARVDWVWLRTDAQPVDAALAPALASAQVWAVDAQALAQWLAPEPGKNLSDHLYLVDPMGMWMMRFPVDADAARVRKDLNRVLMASRFWDQEGRRP